jgi:hypothetical protein
LNRFPGLPEPSSVSIDSGALSVFGRGFEVRL